MDALLRFLNRPVIIRRAHPSRRVRVAFWCLLALWLLANAADLVTTAALFAAHSTHPTYHEGSPVVAWALAHGGVGALVVQKALYAAAGCGLWLLTFRWYVRLTLILVALVCLLVAAVIWNTRLLILH